jgi:hypothetical protein
MNCLLLKILLPEMGDEEFKKSNLEPDVSNTNSKTEK